MTKPIPSALLKRGITHVCDNLPEGAELDISRDFARIFRGEIEARLFGWSNPTSARPVTPGRVPSAPSLAPASA